MAFWDLARFAAASLWGYRLRTALSILGVSIGVTAVLLLTALGEGARKYVTRELEGLGTTFMVVLPGKVETRGEIPFVGGAIHDLTLADTETLQRGVAGIRRIAPVTLGEATTAFGTLHRTGTVLGTTSEFFSLRQLSVARGSVLPPGEIERGAPICVIGPTVEQELFPGVNPLGKILRIGESRFRIIGVLAPKGESIGFNLDDVVIIPVASAMKLFNQAGLFRIFIEGRSPQGLETLKKDVTHLIASRHKGEEDITLITQDAMLAGFQKILTALTLALVGIAAISLTVAGIGIMNVMLVSVTERTSEIGLLKALGVTQAQVLAVFLAEAVLLSGTGGAGGLLLAEAAVGVLREVLPALPTEIPLWSVAAALTVAVGVGILFGVWPALRASRLDPVIALAKK